jgi:DNA polymerase-3 subunit alpha
MKFEICGYEHLHLHSDFSLLDGYGTVEEYAERAKKINQQFLCVTDHGVMGSVPRQIRACEKNKINPLFGCELYVNPFQMELKENEKSTDYTKNMSDEEKIKFKKSYHLLGIAYNNTGYSNLVKLSSWGWCHGFYYRPRVNHEQLKKYKEGIIFTSCCYNGEIGQAFDQGGEDAGYQMIEKYMEMFMPNFYLEVMLLDFEKQKPYDAFIVKASSKYNLPIICTQDCHYCMKEDSHMQRLMLMVQTKNTLKKIQEDVENDIKKDYFELQDTNLWMKSEEELNSKWESDYSNIIDYEVFKQAKSNTVKICNMAKGVELDRNIKLPKIPDENSKLLDYIQEGVKNRKIPNNKKYMYRIKEEYELISNKGLSSYFLIQKSMTDEAKRICPILLGYGDGSEAVGPGRGSVCGSLIAYIIGITDIDPIKHDLMFSRFLSPVRGGKTVKLKFTSDSIN